ncbi:MAG: ferritin family protein [Pseudomonadota bacterium]
MTGGTRMIDSLPEFLAHAQAMEDESAERYEMLADVMEVHHNAEVAVLFRKLMHYSMKHADEVRSLCSGLALPDIAPWEFNWNCPDYPEGGDCFSEMVHYLMSLRQALDVAVHNEIRGRDFYAWIARESPDAEVRRLAAAMAGEEQGHVELLLAWIERDEVSNDPPLEDLDPPNMPEG